MNTAVKVGLFGAAGYVAYRYFLSPHTASPVSSSTPATPVNVPAPAKLDDIYTKMVAAAAADGVGADGASLDAWDVYLGRGGGPAVAPAPETVFGALSRDDRTRKYTAAEYWSKMAPYLRSAGGFAGLGFFGSLCCGGGW